MDTIPVHIALLTVTMWLEKRGFECDSTRQQI